MPTFYLDILNDEKQVLYFECSHENSNTTNKSTVNLRHPIISSIGQECPLHFREESTKLDDSVVHYARLFGQKATINRKSKTNNLTCIRKKYKKLNSTKRFLEAKKKKKLTISEIFSNSSIIIQQDDETSPLVSIKNELLDTPEMIDSNI